MEKKKTLTILFDADDVVENLMECWIALVNERYGTHVDLNDVTDWDVSRAFPGLTHQQVYGLMDEPGFWARLSPLPGCREVLQRLYNEGHTLYLVTATDYRTCRDKVDMLLNMLPFLDWDHMILTHNKQMIRGDVLIDDGPHNLIGGDYLRLLFDRPHNRAFREREEGILRVYSWDEVYEIIQRLAANLPG